MQRNGEAVIPVRVYWDGSKCVVEILEYAAELQGGITSARPMGAVETPHFRVVVHGHAAEPQPLHEAAETL